MKKYTIKRPPSELHLVHPVNGVHPTRFNINYKNELNPAQYEAVTSVNGPLLVVAGAGTGKTRTIVYRVAYLVELGVKPEHILLLTFTRKAAQEMLRRAAILLDSRCEQVSGGTFHSFANSVLRKHASLIGYQTSFTILDQADAEDVVNLLRTQMKLDMRERRFPRKETLYDLYSRSINTLTPLKELLSKDYPHYLDLENDIREVHARYVEYKQKHNLMDYDDLLVNLVRLLKEHEPVRATLSSRYKYIMVDEYQDTNKIQAEIVKLLAHKHQNVLVVGDDSQSIYAFRGANFRNIMDFPKDFPECKVVTIEENYRSTQPILDVANEIIVRAKEKYTKVLYTKKPTGCLPQLVIGQNENLQSKFIVQRVLQLREEGVALNDVAVLFRSSYLSFDLEIELAKAGIPFMKFGGFKFIETAHVKDLVAYLRVLDNPRDVVAWNRILLLLDGVGPRTAERVIDDILQRHMSTGSDAAKFWMNYGEYPDRVKDLFERLKRIQPEYVLPTEKTEEILEHYEPIFRTRYDDYTKRKKDLEMFLTITERYRNVSSLLTDLALEPPNESVSDITPPGKDDECLVLSTIHSAKGLEWHSVFVLYALDGRFPTSRAAEDIDEMEEERRLMYVACTRAKENLFITYPVNIYDRESGMVLSKPSRFIEGIEEKLLEPWVVDEE
jgi:DNA helicase-2/ATP-dependent DNA helicase PcrA